MHKKKSHRANKNLSAPGGLSRRQLFRRSAELFAAASVLPRSVVGGASAPAPSDRLTLAGVGVGGVGYGQVQACEKAGFEVTVLCDIDHAYAKKAYDRWPEARRYTDYRGMFDKEGDKVDAVYIGTPDHTHAVIAMEAIRKKKHICCVKPLTRTIHECRTVVRAAEKAGIATQVTAAANTGEQGCRTCELIRAGAIGDVHEVHAWTNRPLWPQGMLRPPGSDPIPSTLNWDLWIGPAAMRPFKNKWPDDHYAVKQIKTPLGIQWGYNGVYHPWNFRGWWEFGTGSLGDMGCHHVNTPYRALKLTHPVRINASASKVFSETVPLASIVTYEYPAREGMPPVRLLWYDGGLKPSCPPQWGERTVPDEGTLYIGEKGILFSSWNQLEVLPAGRAEKFKNVPRTLKRRSGTWAEWHEACKGGEEAGCNFTWAEYITEFVLLGNIAIRTGKHLAWDAAEAKFTNFDPANKHLKEAYREGWHL